MLLPQLFDEDCLREFELHQKETVVGNFDTSFIMKCDEKNLQEPLVRLCPRGYFWTSDLVFLWTRNVADPGRWDILQLVVICEPDSPLDCIQD